MADTLILIPARMASSRLPGKPLADIGGQPMIVHVLRRAEEAKIGPAVVATDSEAVAAAGEKAGGRAIMTRSDHLSGSDRIYEALEALDPEHRVKVVVNLQGDLPTIDPEAIRASLAPLKDAEVDIATIAVEIADPAERINPNIVKAIGPVAKSFRFRAETFTRANATGNGPHYHHIGLYAYRRAALERFVKLPPSANEQRGQRTRIGAAEVTYIATEDAPLSKAEVVFTALPHGASAIWVGNARASGARVVALSSAKHLQAEKLL